MRVVDGKTYIVGNPWKNWVFVRLETHEGIHGIGEGTLNGFAKTTEACIRELSSFDIGMDPFQIESNDRIDRRFLPIVAQKALTNPK